MCDDNDEWEEADDDKDYGEDESNYGNIWESEYPECGTCRKPKYDCWCLHNFNWQMGVE